MSSGWLSSVIAQATDAGLPIGKAVVGIVFFGLVCTVSLFGLFASKETLESMSEVIGTKNPLVARIACGCGAFVGFLFALLMALSLLGK